MHVDRRVQNTSNNSMDEFVFPVDLVLTGAAVSKLQTVLAGYLVRDLIDDLPPPPLSPKTNRYIFKFSDEMPVKCESDLSAVRLLKEKDPDQLYGAVRHIKNRYNRHFPLQSSL